MKVKLVADFGGTRVKYGVVSGGQLLDQGHFDVEDRRNFAVHLPKLKESFLTLLVGLELALEDCIGLGLALPTLVSADRQRVTRTFGKFEDLPNVDIESWSREELGLRYAIENDARAALIGEWRYGAGRGLANLMMVTLGTGVGTAFVLDDEPLYGRDGAAGNLGGHCIVQREGQLCYCGSKGCVEAEVASWALEDRAKSAVNYQQSSLRECSKIDYRAVFTQAKKGDELAGQLTARAMDVWLALILNGIHFASPQKVIIGGGIMASADVILPELQSGIDREAIQTEGKITIAAAELGDGAALLGF